MKEGNQPTLEPPIERSNNAGNVDEVSNSGDEEGSGSDSESESESEKRERD